ncbi:hypothetical protein [Jannaschia formosa]|uniref:hypothetical protein n=1 Tax=Jannaschia formosa TaxID=2259592 RepID=UPI000E1B7915|nr:hypothetical protein [Jannaschia formosa]TFL16455.1 hypothetical protein DR046_20250 [Jannaschia formosa]
MWKAAVLAGILATPVVAQDFDQTDAVEVLGCSISDQQFSDYTIQCRIVSRSSQPIATVSFALRVSEAGRSIPWSEEGFPGQPPRIRPIRGGLEPGEEVGIFFGSFYPDERMVIENVSAQLFLLEAHNVSGEAVSSD